MTNVAKRLGFANQKAYMLNQSDTPNRIIDCRTLNPASQEK